MNSKFLQNNSSNVKKLDKKKENIYIKKTSSRRSSLICDIQQKENKVIQ